MLITSILPLPIAAPTDASNGESVQSKLAALAARQSKGQTTDPKALTKASTKNARLPAQPVEGGSTTKTTARQKSSKSKRKGEKMKEKALGTSERLGTKVQQRENRKVSLRGCCRKVPCATSVTDLYFCLPLPVSTRTSQTSMGLKLRPPLSSRSFTYVLPSRRFTIIPPKTIVVCDFPHAGLACLVRL